MFTFKQCFKKSLGLSLIFSVALFGCAERSTQKKPTTIAGPVAPEITTKYGWLNSQKSYTLKDFRGKILVLDFWTLGCINCQHIIPDLKKLEYKYSKELVVVGVHSAKFKSERETARIQDAIVKLGIDHPVVNDADYDVWKAYGVEAWPTVVLVTPDGKIAIKHEGEDVFQVLDTAVQTLINTYGDSINRVPFTFASPKDHNPTSILSFPSKIIADPDGSVWVSDYGHNQVIKIGKNGKILLTIGGGEKGFQNGGFDNASFDGPQGLALNNGQLYIADSRNNAIRVADIHTKEVRTAAGNGTMGHYMNDQQRGASVLPNSPWDLLIDSGYLFIANAGNHQILRMALTDNKVYRFAGSGREGIQDSDYVHSSFSQPSGLALVGNFLYVADPEASAIRRIDLTHQKVKTILGKGLFKFGDVDGKASDVLLQHSTSVAESGNNIYIADTYNGKVKLLNVKANTVTTILKDLNEPNDILVDGEDLWITDTNNDRVLLYNVKSKTKRVLDVHK